MIKSHKCDVEFYCEENDFEVIINDLEKCSKYAVCIGLDGEPKCVCKKGYVGNGFFCEPKDVFYYRLCIF